MTPRFPATFSIPVLLWAFALPVAAQAFPDETTRAAARELAEQGIEAYQAAQYPDADQKLEKAYRLFATPTLALWSARARMQLGRWMEATERYREALRASAAVGDSAMQHQAQKDADEELAALTARMPDVTLELEGSDATGVKLSLDGKPLSSELLDVRLPMNPGTHRIAASRGSERAEIEIKLVEKEHKHVPLHLRQVPTAVPAAPVPNATAALRPPLQAAARQPVPAVSDHQPEGDGALVKPIAIAALALGGAGLLTSGISALVGQSECAGGRCLTSAAQAKYDTLRTIAGISFWAGAASAVGGALALILAPKPSVARDAGVSLALTPLGLNVSGEF